MKLSLCLAVYNEEKFIHYPLDSAYDLVDEVIIVDGGSDDKTVEIAKSYGKKVKVFIERNPLMFHINKQKAIERASGEWILQLDADEALSMELKEEIKAIVNTKSKNLNPKQIQNTNDKNKKQKRFRSLTNVVAFYIPRKNFFLTRFLKKGGQYPDYTIRLYLNGYARFPCKDIHENVEVINSKSQAISTFKVKEEQSDGRTLKVEVKKAIGYLKSPILHYADLTFSRYLDRWNRYTSLEANKLLQEVKSEKSKIKSLVRFIDYFIAKPMVTFFSMYFRHKGFIDGFPGFIFALFSSLRFWVIYVKWWSRKI